MIKPKAHRYTQSRPAKLKTPCMNMLGGCNLSVSAIERKLLDDFRFKSR